MLYEFDNLDELLIKGNNSKSRAISLTAEINDNNDVNNYKKDEEISDVVSDSVRKQGKLNLGNNGDEKIFPRLSENKKTQIINDRVEKKIKYRNINFILILFPNHFINVHIILISLKMKKLKTKYVEKHLL